MKRILFFAAILLAFSFNSNAQHQIRNRAYCPVEVTRTCYSRPPMCNAVGSVVYLVPAGSLLTVPSCPDAYTTTWKVCFVHPCSPVSSCTTVDGNAVLSTCGPGTYTGNIVGCDYCTSSATGGTVTYNPLTGDLSITP